MTSGSSVRASVRGDRVRAGGARGGSGPARGETLRRPRKVRKDGARRPLADGISWEADADPSPPRRVRAPRSPGAGVVLAPVLAWGDAAAPAKGGKARTASSERASAAYTSTCSQGNAKYAARDFDGAIDLYRKAIELSPHQGLAHYLLGEAQLAAGNLTEAEASWARASLEAGEKDPALQAPRPLRHRRPQGAPEEVGRGEGRLADVPRLGQPLPRGGRLPRDRACRASRCIDSMIKQDKAVRGRTPAHRRRAGRRRLQRSVEVTAAEVAAAHSAAYRSSAGPTSAPSQTIACKRREERQARDAVLARRTARRSRSPGSPR